MGGISLEVAIPNVYLFRESAFRSFKAKLVRSNALSLTRQYRLTFQSNVYLQTEETPRTTTALGSSMYLEYLRRSIGRSPAQTRKQPTKLFHKATH